jgi:hypothetical protein
VWKSISEGLSKMSEMLDKIQIGSPSNSQTDIGYDHLYHEGLPGIAGQKRICVDLGLWDVVNAESRLVLD